MNQVTSLLYLKLYNVYCGTIARYLCIIKSENYSNLNYIIVLGNVSEGNLLLMNHSTSLDDDRLHDAVSFDACYIYGWNIKGS